jgi:hypothetical protein
MLSLANIREAQTGEAHLANYFTAAFSCYPALVLAVHPLLQQQFGDLIRRTCKPNSLFFFFFHRSRRVLAPLRSMSSSALACWSLIVAFTACTHRTPYQVLGVDLRAFVLK